jgi:hypothetical protein
LKGSSWPAARIATTCGGVCRTKTGRQTVAAVAEQQHQVQKASHTQVRSGIKVQLQIVMYDLIRSPPLLASSCCQWRSRWCSGLAGASPCCCCYGCF